MLSAVAVEAPWHGRPKALAGARTGPGTGGRFMRLEDGKFIVTGAAQGLVQGQVKITILLVASAV